MREVDVGPITVPNTDSKSLSIFLVDFFNWTWSNRADSDVYRPLIYFTQPGEKKIAANSFSRNPTWEMKPETITAKDMEEIRKDLQVLDIMNFFCS